MCLPRFIPLNAFLDHTFLIGIYELIDRSQVYSFFCMLSSVRNLCLPQPINRSIRKSRKVLFLQLLLGHFLCFLVTELSRILSLDYLEFFHIFQSPLLAKQIAKYAILCIVFIRFILCRRHRRISRILLLLQFKSHLGGRVKE